MIEISNLTKRYGNRIALDNISFVVEKGEVVGLLGPNGAGKSTTMNILTGYISYNEGSVKIDGLEVIDNPNKVKAKIGYLPEHPPLYLDMTVYDYLDFVFKLKKVTFEKREHLNTIMKEMNILDVQERLIKNLSKGYRQRIGIAGALIGDPEILILDEPTVGLDPVQNIEVRNLIKKLGKDKTVILNSHILPEVSAICDKIIIINNGIIVAQDTTENLTSGDMSLEEIFVKLVNEDVSIDDIYEDEQLSCEELIDSLENEGELKDLADYGKLIAIDEDLDEDDLEEDK